MGWAMGMAYFDELVGYTGHCGSLFNKRNGMGLLFSFSSLLFFRPLYNEWPNQGKSQYNNQQRLRQCTIIYSDDDDDANDHVCI